MLKVSEKSFNKTSFNIESKFSGLFYFFYMTVIKVVAKIIAQ